MTISGTELVALLPLLILAGTAVVVMLGIAWRRHHGATVALTVLGLLLAILSLPRAAELGGLQVTPLLVIDGFALFFIGLVCAASLVVVLLSYGYARRRRFALEPQEQREELYLLLLLGTLGAAVLAASDHFASLLLGIELLSVSLYTLIAYPRDRRRSLEAGLKYLILAAASSAFLLFGMALVYAQLGTLDFAALGSQLDGQLLSVAGIGLMLAGIGFKLALVPFHLWTPDVYVGAPAPVAAFIASVSKGGVFAVALRFLVEVEGAGRALVLALTLIAIASMLAGNLLALLQDNVKRLLAYSSIAHLGYALVALLASGTLAVEAASYYVTAYVATILAAFGVVAALSNEEGEPESLDDYRGLFWRRPALAALFVASLLSLAGIPLTAGFLGKFYVLLAGVESSLWLPVLTLVLGSVIGLFYYLRVVVALFSPAEGGEERALPEPGWTTGLALGALALAIVWLGVHPEPVVRLMQDLFGAMALGKVG